MPKSKTITVVRQALLLKHWYPESEVEFDHKGLTWSYTLTPHPHCAAYDVRIEYELGFVPRAYVDKPTLFCPVDVKLPHCNDQVSQWLCLSYQKANDWLSCMYIARTTVPWISEWLVHYEVWCVTGTWEGGGFHVGPVPWERQRA